MKTVFADTAYWVALLSPKDSLHERALNVGKSIRKFRTVTTEMVLDEPLAPEASPAPRAAAVRAVEAILADPNVEVVPQTSLQFRAAFDRYRACVDKEWSLTDCASFALMQARGMSEALAYDRDFDQAGFVALLRQ